MNYPHIKKYDPELYGYLEHEIRRQTEGLELIPSENYVSLAVLEAMGSILTNKYSEGYPYKRYYGGNKNIDAIETLAQDRARSLFGVPYVNVQPYSGSPANNAVIFSLLEPSDTLLGFALTAGGHLTHGAPGITFSGKYVKSLQYGVNEKTGEIDYDEVQRLALSSKPKLIICGLTAYPYTLDFKRFSEIAQKVDAYLMADIAHIAGLVIGGVSPSPVPYADIVTTTTHKTLRGPRGAMIMVTKKGLSKDPDLGSKIDKAIFPGMQGGPHDHTTAGIAVALLEASRPEFTTYAKQIVKNAHALADSLMKNGFTLVSNGTQNHLMLISLVSTLGPGSGVFASYALDEAGITVNKNTIPGEPMSPFYPSGIRLGTPALTTRGMKEKEMDQIAGYIKQVIELLKPYHLPEDKASRKSYIENFKKEISRHDRINAIKAEIRAFTASYPLFAW